MTQQKLQTGLAASALRVLIVEDDWAFRNIVTSQLRRLGCLVQGTSNASEFFSKLVMAEKPFDLAIVDFQLPGLTGDKIVTWVRDSELNGLNTLPILVITGNPGAFPALSLTDRKRLGMLRKPYRFAELKEAISKLIVNGSRH